MPWLPATTRWKQHSATGGSLLKRRRMGDAPTRNRTENLLIKSQLLCQLSYRRAGGNIVRQGRERKLSRLCVFASVRLVLPCPQGESNPCSHLERVVS